MSEGERPAIFTRADLQYIDDHPEIAADELAEKFGVPKRSVSIARKRMISDKVGDPWSIEDDEFIRATPNLTQHQVARYLGRTSVAIKTRRRMLRRLEGLSFGGSGPTKNPVHVGGRPLVAKTCRKCGLLLSGSWFHRTPTRYSTPEWTSHCKRCRSEAQGRREDRYERPKGRSDAGRASSERLQALTVDNASRSNEPWLESDDVVLRDETLTLIEKALKLNRTYYATANACVRYGYKSRRDGLGDPERDQWIIVNPNLTEVA